MIRTSSLTMKMLKLIYLNHSRQFLKKKLSKMSVIKLQLTKKKTLVSILRMIKSTRSLVNSNRIIISETFQIISTKWSPIIRLSVCPLSNHNLHKDASNSLPNHKVDSYFSKTRSLIHHFSPTNLMSAHHF
jgi:hypothetical protein